MAIAASVAAIMMNPVIIGVELPPHLMQFINDPNFTFAPLWQVIIVTLIAATICGVWNGALVAYANIQPMVATLILMYAGRGIAQLITNGVRIQIFYEPYAQIGGGWAILPISAYIVVGVFVLAWLLTRKTAIGLFIESVGVNARSSFFSGIEEKKIKLLAYTFCGFAAGVAGLVASSNIRTSDANNIGLDYELDAILAVVIGGTLMTGGRFSLLASIVGGLVIQAITTSMYAVGVAANAVLAIKGVVVILVILLYSEQVRALVRRVTAQKGV
jgi:ribose/xylose/arabinose/galactoside ABC-type transport system permease subunit